MSFIIGLNLSDRIYLSADTRLTKKDEVNNFIYVDDNFCKIELISNEIAVAAAGSAKLAAFIINKLLKSDIIHNGIRHCRNNIQQAVSLWGDEYLTKYQGYTAVTLIFGGVNKKERKKINLKKYLDVTKHYQETAKNPMNMKEVIFQAIAAKSGPVDPNPTLSVADSHVFAVKIDLPNVLEIEDVDWGDYVAYGAGLTKKHLPDILFGELETSRNAGQLGHDNAMLAAFLKTTAEEQGKLTVGGAVLNVVIWEGGIGAITGEIDRINIKTGEKESLYSGIKTENGKIYRLTKEGPIEMKLLRDYPFNEGEFEI